MTSSTLYIVLFFIITNNLFQWNHFISFVESKPALITDPTIVEGKVIKGTRNGLYLIKNGKKSLFPDFHTFTSMGFTSEGVVAVDNTLLDSLSVGDPITVIPMFRPEDYMYHNQCDYPENMVNDLGVVANMGNYFRLKKAFEKVRRTRQLQVLALGGSITAGGYYMDFVRQLQEKQGLNVTVHNHGHGATELTYTIFCVDVDSYSPDLVLIDFSVNDYGHPKLMDSLIRKSLSLKSNPEVILVNLWATASCPVTRYLHHALYYNIPVINLCPAITLCYGKNHLPKWRSDLYSLTDGVHPWGEKGVPFIGGILYHWWLRMDTLLTTDASETIQYTERNTDLTSSSSDFQQYLSFPKQPLYFDKSIGLCTRCDALVNDAPSFLTPIEEPVGFKVITRVKVGFGGFGTGETNIKHSSSSASADHGYPRGYGKSHSSSGSSSGSIKSFKKSWQADTPGSTIKFRFYGTSVKIAIWQRRDSMGVLKAVVDGDEKSAVEASGFFKGYTWAMHKNNTGRSEIIPLFEGLEDKEHVLTLIVTDKPANVWVKGHMCQIFALLAASNNPDCKTVKFTNT